MGDAYKGEFACYFANVVGSRVCNLDTNPG